MSKLGILVSYGRVSVAIDSIDAVDPDNTSLEVTALRARQPIGDLYFGVMDA